MQRVKVPFNVSLKKGKRSKRKYSAVSADVALTSNYTVPIESPPGAFARARGRFLPLDRRPGLCGLRAPGAYRGDDSIFLRQTWVQPWADVLVSTSSYPVWHVRCQGVSDNDRGVFPVILTNHPQILYLCSLSSFYSVGLGGTRTHNQRLKRATSNRVYVFVVAEYLPYGVSFRDNSQRFASYEEN